MKKVSIKLSDDEFGAIAKAAMAANTTVSDAIRQRIFAAGAAAEKLDEIIKLCRYNANVSSSAFVAAAPQNHDIVMEIRRNIWPQAVPKE